MNTKVRKTLLSRRRPRAGESPFRRLPDNFFSSPVDTSIKVRPELFRRLDALRIQLDEDHGFRIPLRRLVGALLRLGILHFKEATLHHETVESRDPSLVTITIVADDLDWKKCKTSNLTVTTLVHVLLHESIDILLDSRNPASVILSLTPPDQSRYLAASKGKNSPPLAT